MARFACLWLPTAFAAQYSRELVAPAMNRSGQAVVGALERQAYVWLPNGPGCESGFEITSATECGIASQSLGFTPTTAGVGAYSWAPLGCILEGQSWQWLHFNTIAGTTGRSIYRSLCRSPTAAPTPAPIPYPTFPPTPVPTPPAGPAAGGASAVGDPHLTTIHGERFDLMAVGKHVLINIPRKRVRNVYLRVEAEAQRIGGQCADIYFQELNVTGSWAYKQRAGGFHYNAHDAPGKRAQWIRYGRHVQLKVAYGRTQQGVKYLNMYVKGLDRTGSAVGGLLGEDDHEDAMTPTADCTRQISLSDRMDTGGEKPSSQLSVATASLA